MYIILSPSKSQDFSRNFDVKLNFKKTDFLKETGNIHSVVKTFSKKDLEKLMKISPKLSELNFDRFQKWNNDFSKRKKECDKDTLSEKTYNFSPAIFAFTGDVYGGFDLENWKKDDFNFAQKHLGILSGFYGLISPLDLIKPYRLEMGTKISFKINDRGFKNLYDFWNEKLTKKVNDILKKEKTLINLASNEYFKSLNKVEIEKSFNIINIEFKIKNKDELKIIAIYAKKARGEMANWIIKNRVKKTDNLKKFNVNGWKFSIKNSEKNKLVFIKKISG